MSDSSGPESRKVFVGEGPLPSDLDAPNWGAAVFIYMWLWLYGFKRWAIGITVFYVALIVVQNILLLVLDVRLVLEDLPRWSSLVLEPLWWAGQVYFGLNVNRLLWERESRRFLDADGDPPHPIPLERFRKSTRFWTVFTFALIGVGVLAQIVLLAAGKANILDVVTSLPMAFIPLGAMLAIDVRRRVTGRRAS